MMTPSIVTSSKGSANSSLETRSVSIAILLCARQLRGSSLLLAQLSCRSSTAPIFERSRSGGASARASQPARTGRPQHIRLTVRGCPGSVPGQRPSGNKSACGRQCQP